MVDADIIGYYLSPLDGARMVHVWVDGQHLHYRVADLAVAAASACRSVTVLRDDVGEECGRIVDDRDIASMSDGEYEDFLFDEGRELDEEFEREREAAAAEPEFVPDAQIFEFVRRMIDTAKRRAAWAERHFEQAAADYCRIHLGTAIRATDHETQRIHELKADVYETRAVLREMGIAA